MKRTSLSYDPPDIYELKDDRLNLKCFRDYDHAFSEFHRLKHEFDRLRIDVYIIHEENSNNYHQLILKSTSLSELQRAVDVIFNENQFELLKVEDQLYCLLAIQQEDNNNENGDLPIESKKSWIKIIEWFLQSVLVMIVIAIITIVVCLITLVKNMTSNTLSKQSLSMIIESFELYRLVAIIIAIIFLVVSAYFHFWKGKDTWL